MHSIKFALLLILLMSFNSCKDCIKCTAKKHTYKNNKLDSTIYFDWADYCGDDAENIRVILKDSVKVFYPNEKDSSTFFDIGYSCFK